MLPKAATSSRPCGAAATCCASRMRSRSASPPDRFYGELVSSLLPTGPRRKWRGFCFGGPIERRDRVERSLSLLRRTFPRGFLVAGLFLGNLFACFLEFLLLHRFPGLGL